MQFYTLKRQISLFGGYPEVVPSVDVIKFFIDALGYKNLVPNQFKEINVNLKTREQIATNTEVTRLRLTSEDTVWNISFKTDRIDYSVNNMDLGISVVPSFSDFVNETNEIQKIIEQKFPKKMNRIGIVNQYFITGVDVSDISKKINQTIELFKEKAVIESIKKVVARMEIQDPMPEVLNMSTEFRVTNINTKLNGNRTVLSGILVSIDVNTINENREYRFNISNIEKVIAKMAEISTEVENQSFNLVK